MVLNKRGQAIVVGIGIFVIVFILAVIFIEPMKDFIIIARDSDHLDCTNTSIITGQKMTCILVDLYLPYFFWVVVGSGAAYLSAKSFNDFVQ